MGLKRYKVELFVTTDIAEVDGDYIADHLAALLEKPHTWKVSSNIEVYEVHR